jgi:hypothetical protein
MKSKSEDLNVLPQLRKLDLDNHEAIAALQSAANAGGSRQTGKRTYELSSGEDVIAKVRFNKHLVLSSIAMPVNVWKACHPLIEADAKIEQTRIARSVLFSYRAPSGFARVPGWLQLRPVTCPLEDRTAFGALTSSVAAAVPRPFVIELVYRYSDLPFLRGYRSLRAVQEAKWLLSAFIDVPVFGLGNPYSWAFWNGSYQLVQCGMATGLEDTSEVEFSDVQALPELIAVANSQYFSELGVATQEFRVPKLNVLHAKYMALSPENRVRFLRSCASLAAASDPTLGASQRVVALVSAIEPLLGEAERCGTCGGMTGITRQFRKFLDEYVQPPSAVRYLYEAVYDARSKLVHGGWNFDVDEAILGLRLQSDTVPLVAYVVAKRGVVNWLLAQ